MNVKWHYIYDVLWAEMVEVSAIEDAWARKLEVIDIWWVGKRPTRGEE